MGLKNPISKRNTALISEFARHCETLGLKPRVAKYVMHLKRLADWLRKDFDQATKPDIENLVHRIETSDYSAWTK